MSSEVVNIGKLFPEKISHFKKAISKKAGIKDLPIGMFDSGVGGLTVLSEALKQIPHEDVLYLADTARVPYGGRAPEEIININIEILDYFADLGVKMVIVACGTSSAIAYPVLRDRYEFPIVSLIYPGSQAAVANSKNLKIGVIATQGTVNSCAYQKTIQEINKDAKVFAVPCPLFVPLIEGGFIEADETRKVAREYLAPLIKEGIDTLILGCTHYPHLADILREIAGPDVIFIDPAEYAVKEAFQILDSNNMLNPGSHKAKYEYFTTGTPMQFEALGSRLFSRVISNVKQVKL